MKKIYTLLFALIMTTAMYAQVEVIFRVDMNTTAPDAGGVFVTGNWMDAAGLSGDWQEPGSNTDAQLTDPDGDGVYVLAVMMPAGDYQYKYANGSGWANGEAGGDNDNYQADLSSCGGIDNGYGGFNRSMTVPSETSWTTPNYLFNSCEASLVSTDDLSTLSGVKIFPNPATSNVFVQFENSNGANHQIAIFSMTGQMVDQMDLGNADQFELNVTDYAAGLYLISFRNEKGEIGSRKLVVK